MKGEKRTGKAESIGKFKNVCRVGGKKIKKEEHTKPQNKSLEEMVKDHITSTDSEFHLKTTCSPHFLDLL